MSDLGGAPVVADTPDPNAPQRRYRLYVDESGDHSYRALTEPGRQYLALMGVWFLQDQPYWDFCQELQHLKDEVFGPRPDDPIILHRKKIIGGKGPFGLLRRPDLRSRFNARLLGLIESANFRMTCVLLDKKKHQKRYSSPFHPYNYCLAALLERYCGWLNHMGAVGDVLAEARGRTEDKQLQEAYARTLAEGTFFHQAEFFRKVLTSSKIKFKTKERNISGLQLADLLAAPIKAEMIATCESLPPPSGFGFRIAEVAKGSFNRGNYGKITGYGKVWLSGK